jgi:hypothetical protein
MSTPRRIAFARARRPVAVAMRVVAAARATLAAEDGGRRSVFGAPRNARRGSPREAAAPRPALPPRGCEDLH